MLDLSNMPVLDTVIGLAFVYFLLSLVISSLTEAISSVLNVRWSKLEQGMRELFAGASDTKAYDDAMKALDGHDFTYTVVTGDGLAKVAQGLVGRDHSFSSNSTSSG